MIAMEQINKILALNKPQEVDMLLNKLNQT